jgi:hypothetical protein
MAHLALALILIFTGAYAYFLPLDHPAYEPLDFLAGQGLLPALNGNTKPYEAEKAAAALAVLDTSRLTRLQKYYWQQASDYLGLFSAPRKDNALLLEMYLHGSNDYFDTASHLFRGCGGVTYSYGRFTLSNRVSADLTDQKLRFDHLDRQFKSDIPSDMPQAYLSYSGGHFGLLAGRNALKWGPGKFGNLILGDHQPSMNMLSGWGRIGFLNGYTVSAKLGAMGDTNRYFSATRLVISVSRDISLALNQSVVYSGLKRGPELYYILPSYIYYFSQFGFSGGNETENAFVGADGEWRIRNKVRLYFEFLADDFQVDRDPVSQGTQNALAWLAGAECPALFTNGGGGVEYARINSYVYKHLGGRATHYIANLHGGVIGDALGPDAEELDLWADARVTQHLKGRLHYALVRQGDLNDVDGAWDAYGKAGAAIPHGKVQNTNSLSLEAGLTNVKGLSVSGFGGYRWIVNRNHTAELDQGPWFELKMVFYAGYFFNWNSRETLFPLGKKPVSEKN